MKASTSLEILVGQHLMIQELIHSLPFEKRAMIPFLSYALAHKKKDIMKEMGRKTYHHIFIGKVEYEVIRHQTWLEINKKSC